MDNSHENSNGKKHNYVKVLVDDPFNNWDIVENEVLLYLKFPKKQNGVYICLPSKVSHMYEGHSINL